MQKDLIFNLARITDLNTLNKCLQRFGKSPEKSGEQIKAGIEGCIGNTPLIKIKSLSEATGCEILAKAEVRNMGDYGFCMIVDDGCTVSQRRRQQPERPGCVEHSQNGSHML